MGVVERGVGWRRRIAALMLALALLLLPAARAVAGHVLPGYEQWDDWGRWPPLPTYVPVWSADPKVCPRILRALKGAGPSPASLYGNPIFLRWQSYAAFRKDNEDEQSFAGWIEVPLFNDGKLAIAVKVTEQNARFEEQTLFVFDDLNYFEARTRVDFMGLWNDPRLLQPLKQFMENNLGSFAAIPKTMRDADYWSHVWFENNVEINVATVVGKIYLVVREPALEAVLVLLFSDDRKGHAVCVIGPKKLVQ